MVSPIKKNGTLLSDIFDPWKPGTDKAPATNIKENGVDTSDIYAMLKYGTAAAPTGIKKNNADLCTIYAAKGTARYTLPIDGQSYTHNTGRGTATITVTFKADGTYTIVGGATLASGTWLPAGDSASSYTVKYSETGAANGPDPDGGGDSYSNGAPSPTAVSSSPAFSISASATTTGTDAGNYCGLTISLYKSGILRLSATCDLSVSAAG